MAEKRAKPLILPSPPPTTTRHFFRDPLPSSSPSAQLIHRSLLRHAPTARTKKGKPWLNCRLSSQGERTLHSLAEPQFDVYSDFLGIIKALGYLKKCDLALSVFEWIKNPRDSQKLINGPVVVVAVVISSSMLGKNGRVSLLDDLVRDGYGIDAYNIILNVYGKMGMPRHKIMGVFDGMKSSGVAPDRCLYVRYNTMIFV